MFSHGVKIKERDNLCQDFYQRMTWYYNLIYNVIFILITVIYWQQPKRLLHKPTWNKKSNMTKSNITRCISGAYGIQMVGLAAVIGHEADIPLSLRVCTCMKLHFLLSQTTGFVTWHFSRNIGLCFFSSCRWWCWWRVLPALHRRCSWTVPWRRP